MIQTYKHIKNFVNSYNNSINGQYGQVQKLYSTPHLICIILRFKGQTRYFYLGRGNHFEGIWEGSEAPPSEYRIRERFLEYLRKFLIGARIGPIIADSKDRILVLPYYQENEKNYLAFFWKGRTLYFLNTFNEKGKNRLFCSWVGQVEEIDKTLEEQDIPRLFDPLGTEQVDQEKEGPEFSILEYFQKLNKETDASAFSSRKKKFFERKEKKIQNDLKKIDAGDKIRAVLDDPEFFIGDKKELTISGIKFKFNKTFNEYKKRGQIFEKIKGFKKAEELLQKRLMETRKEKNKFEKGEEKKGISGIKVIEPFWSLRKEKPSFKSEYNVDFFQTKSGLKLAIGKDTAANDYLRTKWAKKDDFWFHLEGHKSGHLFVKGDIKFEEELFCDLGSLIRDYSKLEITEIPLVYTQVKNLKGLKGKSGAVTHKKAKFLRVAYGGGWGKNILKL